jgi:hypothetical protein
VNVGTHRLAALRVAATLLTQVGRRGVLGTGGRLLAQCVVEHDHAGRAKLVANDAVVCKEVRAFSHAP